MTNLALNRPADMSSTSRWSKYADSSKEASIGNNGDISDEVFFHSDIENNPWWQVDLGDIYNINRIKIFNRSDQKDKCKAFKILWSSDGETYFTLYRRTSANRFNELDLSFDVEMAARYVRVQLLGHNFLHLREIEIYGAKVPIVEAERILKQAADNDPASHLYQGREGHFVQIGIAEIFNDQKYSKEISNALEARRYEHSERHLVADFLRPDDKLLEIGTAVGAVSMTAASIIGPENVITFDANPEIVADACANFAYNGLGTITSHTGILKNRAQFKPGENVDFYISHAFWASRMFIGGSKDDIIKTVSVPTFCLEDEIAKFGATVIVCDIEGGEVELLHGADLSRIRLIIIETHYWAAGEREVDDMMGYLINQGFSLHLGASKNHVSVLRRHSS